MSKGNWLSSASGTSHRFDLLELVSSPPLKNGVVVYCGRITIPAYDKLMVGESRHVALEDGRTGDVLILETTSTEATFCGRLVK